VRFKQNIPALQKSNLCRETQARAGWPWWGLSLLIFVAGPNFARAVPPLVTDDPGTAEKAQFELFTGLEYLSEDHSITRHVPAFELDYGVTDRLQLTFAIPYVSTQGTNGFGDVTLELKYNFLKDQRKLPNASLTFEWTLPTASFSRGLGSGADAYFIHLPLEKTWGRFTALADFGYTIVGEPSLNGEREARKNTWVIGFAQKYQLAKRTNLLSEIYWETSDEPSKPSAFAASIGVEREIVKDFCLQAAVGRSLRDDARGGPDLRVYVGVHWFFDAPWKRSDTEKGDRK